MKKVLFSLFIIFMLCGCYNYKELNDYAIATGLAIDYKDNEYIASLLISNSNKGSQNQESQNVVYSAKGKSIYEAIRNIDLISPKETYIGHLSVVILSENTARKGLYDPLELLLTDPQSNKDFYVALAKNTDAINILKITSPLMDFPSQYVKENIKSADNLQGSVVSVDFNALLKALINENTNPVLNGFSVIEGAEEKQIESLNNYSLDSYIKLDTLGYFKNDKLIGWATKDESRGINLINNNVDQMYVDLKCSDGSIIINADQLNTTININSSGNTNIIVNGRGKINEITCDINLEDNQETKKIKEKLNRELESYINKAIQLSQANETDLFGIGQKYYQNYPHNYKKVKDWNKYFQKIKVDIKVDIQLEENGSSEQSIERISNEKNY